jgi:hypothetical protein
METIGSASPGWQSPPMSAELAAKYAEIACESASFGFDGRVRADYVERS